MRSIFFAVFIVALVFFAPSRVGAQDVQESDSSGKAFHSLAYQTSFGGRFQGISWVFETEKKKRGKAFGLSAVKLTTPEGDRVLGATLEGGLYTRAINRKGISLIAGLNIGLLMGRNKHESQPGAAPQWNSGLLADIFLRPRVQVASQVPFYDRLRIGVEISLYESFWLGESASGAQLHFLVTLHTH